MKYTLDRFEGDFALLEQEDRTMLQVRRTELPADVKEGSFLTLTDGVWALCEDDRAERIRSKIENLWQ